VLVRLARFCYRRRWLVLGIWVALLVVLNIASGAIGTNYHTEFNQPDSESKQVQDALTAGGNEADAGFPASIVFSADQGNQDPTVKATMTQFFDQVKAMDGVNLISPYDPEGQQLNSPAGSPSNSLGRDVSFAQLTITERDQKATQDFADAVERALASGRPAVLALRVLM